MNIQELARTRILQDMVGRVRDSLQQQQTRRYIAMMVDDRSLRVLSSCCKVYDILEEGVTVVEHVTRKRQALPLLECIYFLSPDLNSIDALCNDFVNEKAPQYKAAHVFITKPLGSIERDAMARMSACGGLLLRLKTFVEFNLDFIAYERRVFHFDDASFLGRVMPPSSEDGTLLPELGPLAERLLTVCTTLNDRPEIRFHSNNLRLNEQLASLLHQKINKLDIPGMTKGKTQLLVIDRTIDLAAVLVHEYTYQAAIYDLLDVPCCTPATATKTPENEPPLADDAISYPVTLNDGKVERRVALLNEEDEVFVRYRHHHLMTALKKVPQEIQKFLAENGAAKLKLRKGEHLSNEELQKAIRDIPEFQEMLSKYSLHHSLSQRCIQEMNRLGLPKAGPLEQDLATSVDAAGKELTSKKILNSLGNVLATGGLGSEEKLRLLLLYFAMTDGVKEDDRPKIVEVAQLPLEYRKVVDLFHRMKLTEGSTDQSAPAPSQHCHRLSNDRERKAYFVARAKTVDVALSRFQPLVKEVIRKLVTGSLHGGKFPLIAAPEMDRAQLFGGPVEGRTNDVRVRARDRDWDFTFDQQQDQEASQQTTTTASNNKTVVVFVLGGVTMSEIRSCYELAKQMGVEICIGGTSIVTPKNFIQMLRRLNTPQWGSQS